MTKKDPRVESEPIIESMATDEPQATAVEDGEAAPSGVREEDLVPGWLALLVLVLLLAVVGLGGFVLRGVLTNQGIVTPAKVAVSDWKAKVDANPDDAASLLGLAYAYQQGGEFDRALTQYDAVLEREPENLAAMYNKGVILLELGQTKKAEDVLWSVLKIAPDHALAAKTLGQLYVDQKHYKSALVAIDPVIKVRPELSDLQYLSGYANEQLGNSGVAIERYRAALKYTPQLTEAIDGLRRLGQGK